MLVDLVGGNLSVLPFAMATSLTALDVLAEAENIEVNVLGGRLRIISQSFVGPVTEFALERMSFDPAFMGADGVRADPSASTRRISSRLG